MGGHAVSYRPASISLMPCSKSASAGSSSARAGAEVARRARRRAAPSGRVSGMMASRSRFAHLRIIFVLVSGAQSRVYLRGGGIGGGLTLTVAARGGADTEASGTTEASGDGGSAIGAAGADAGAGG